MQPSQAFEEPRDPPGTLAASVAQGEHAAQAQDAVAPEPQTAAPVLRAVHSASTSAQARRKPWKAHLTLDGVLALCGLALTQPSPSLVFHYDDCQRCRQAARKQGLGCAGCGEPLLRPAAPGLCYACVQAREG